VKKSGDLIDDTTNIDRKSSSRSSSVEESTNVKAIASTSPLVLNTSKKKTDSGNKDKNVEDLESQIVDDPVLVSDRKLDENIFENKRDDNPFDKADTAREHQDSAYVHCPKECTCRKVIAALEKNSRARL